MNEESVPKMNVKPWLLVVKVLSQKRHRDKSLMPSMFLERICHCGDYYKNTGKNNSCLKYLHRSQWWSLLVDFERNNHTACDAGKGCEQSHMPIKPRNSSQRFNDKSLLKVAGKHMPLVVRVLSQKGHVAKKLKQSKY